MIFILFSALWISSFTLLTFQNINKIPINVESFGKKNCQLQDASISKVIISSFPMHILISYIWDSMPSCLRTKEILCTHFSYIRSLYQETSRNWLFCATESWLTLTALLTTTKLLGYIVFILIHLSFSTGNDNCFIELYFLACSETIYCCSMLTSILRSTISNRITYLLMGSVTRFTNCNLAL